MAHKRMFTKQVTESDSFMSMPLSAQALYFHLGMNADDDGFLNNVKSIQRLICASDDDLRILFARRFILDLDDGIIVIKHWKMNNYIRSDRYHKTQYKEKLALLTVKDNMAYTLNASTCENTAGIPSGIPNVYQLDTENRIDKNRLDKSSKDILSDSGSEKDTFCKEVIDYLNAKIGSHYKPTSSKTKSLISARKKEGFTLDDFKAVIDKKVSGWLNDPEMSKYLRPETLFGTKFEGYLNEIQAQKTYFTADSPQEGGEGWLNEVDLSAYGLS